MQKQSFMRADEVAQELGISKSHAYKVIHGLNEELQEKGYLTISGRVNREFFREKYYYTKTVKSNHNGRLQGRKNRHLAGSLSLYRLEW